jgi:hypothetical protein
MRQSGDFLGEGEKWRGFQAEIQWHGSFDRGFESAPLGTISIHWFEQEMPVEFRNELAAFDSWVFDDF